MGKTNLKKSLLRSLFLAINYLDNLVVIFLPPIFTQVWDYELPACGAWCLWLHQHRLVARGHAEPRRWNDPDEQQWHGPLRLQRALLQRRNQGSGLIFRLHWWLTSLMFLHWESLLPLVIRDFIHNNLIVYLTVQCLLIASLIVI